MVGKDGFTCMKVRRVFVLAAALAVALGCLGRPAAAADNAPEDVYVLCYTDQGIEGYEDFDAKRLYASDHYGGLYVDEDGDGIREADWNWTNFSVLNMVNTRKLAQGGEGAYASIPVYCADAVTDGVPGYQYRRINLEDSGFFSDQTAGRLRAVFLASFPYQRDMDAVGNAVNNWIEKSGKNLEKITNLTESEAISATQAAIWALTNDAEVYAPYLGTGGYYKESDMVDVSIFRQQPSEFTKGNITGLYEYLMALEPVAPLGEIVSDTSFTDASLKMTENEDGTYTAAVSVTVSATVAGEDSLTLGISSGNLKGGNITVANGTNTYEMTLVGLESNRQPITLTISGTQYASDVFLFDPMNGREKSQTMLGYDSSSLPVFGEYILDPTDRILNIYKTTGDGVPLENITFEIYAVGSLREYLNGELSIGETPSPEDVEHYTGVSPLATVTTDRDGVASWNFGAVDGVYLVKELPSTVIEKVVDPFFAAVPGGDGEQKNYAVNVYPKNTVIVEDVTVEKDVADLDRDRESLDVGKIHTWIIRASIPAGIADAQKFEISDKLDYRLNYMGNVKVSVAENAAELGENLLVLEPGTDYQLTVSKTEIQVEEAGYETDSLWISLTRSGMEKAGSVRQENTELRLCFDAVINANAVVSQDIPNRAKLSYTNSVGTSYERESDIPCVYTGGLKLHKTDASDITKTLSGATFRLGRCASPEEIEVGLSQKFQINGQELELVFVDFFDNERMEGDRVTEVTTGQDGVALFYGVAYGDYYLVETKAPEGYNLMTEPVAVTVGADSHLDDDLSTPETLEGSSVTVKNSAKFLLPATGGMGTAWFTIGGVAIVSFALVIFAFPAKKKES